MTAGTHATTGAPPAVPSGMVELGGLPPLRDYLRSAWRRRDFARSMAASELRSQNFDTVLGNTWQLLNPLLQILVYYLIFDLVLNTSRGTNNFIGFLSVGVFVYGFLQRSVTNGAGAIIGNLGLIRSLQFPRMLLPTSIVLKEIIAFGTSAVVMVVVVLLTETKTCVWTAAADRPEVCDSFVSPVMPSWLMFAPLFALMVLFALGCALIAARLTDHVRDTANILPFLFRLSFYGSGVLFNVDRFIAAEWMREIFNANPFYGFVTLSRHYLLHSYDDVVPMHIWAWLVFWSVGLFVTGLLFFRKREASYGRG